MTLKKYMKGLIVSLLAFFIIVPFTVSAENATYNLHLHSETLEQKGEGEQHLEIREINNGTIQKVIVDSGKKTVELTKGDYEITTTQAPYGFKTIEEPIQFSVPFVTKEDGTTLSDYTIELKLEEILKDVIVTKKDKDTDDRLSGAIFDIAQVNNEGRIITLFEDLETNDEGQFRVDGVGFGDYEFIETIAPNGYERLTESVAFTVDDSSEDIIEITIFNNKIPTAEKPKPEEPKKETIFERTGTSAIGLGLFAIVGVVGSAIFVNKKKKDK